MRRAAGQQSTAIDVASVVDLLCFDTPTLQDKLQDRAPGAFGGYRGGRREAGLLAAACEAYAGAHTIWIVLADVSIAACGMSANVG